MSDLERQLELSIEYVRMRKLLKEQTEELERQILENDILRQEIRILELRLQRKSA